MNAHLTLTAPLEPLAKAVERARTWCRSWWSHERLNHTWIPLDLSPDVAEDVLRCAVVSALLRTPGALQVPPPELLRGAPGLAAWRLGVWTHTEHGQAVLDELRRNLESELTRRGIPALPRDEHPWSR